ncbi:hypothetical protein GF386_05205 [Candidatus Pacearchaeota archaeon]|nr:hypothetical protein [Candidatus Pacearchaeota archaeon]MBD3283507.1 hypothetical protein [Candidatus Pacearchaeota archaeon]
MDFPLNLNTAILGTLIIGVGYIGLALRNRMVGLKKLDFFDKLIQSLLFGTFTFIFTLRLGAINLPISDENMANYIVKNPAFFFVQFFILIFSVFLVVSLEEFFDRYFVPSQPY